MNDETIVIRADRRVLATFAVLGILCTVLAPIVPFFLESPVLGAVLMSFPLGATGLWLLTRLPQLARTRIVIGADSLLLEIPCWDGGRLHRAAPVQFPLAAITRLGRRRVTYGPASLPTVVDEFVIEAMGAQHVLTKNICRRPERVLEILAERTGRRVEELAILAD